MAEQSSILRVERVSKTYSTPEHDVRVLDDISFSLNPGAISAIVGPSGSGKTTLLALCAGLDHVSSGEIFLDGVPLSTLDEDARATQRARSVGFVFQSFHLIPTLTALENVMVPLELQGVGQAAAEESAKEMLDFVGLSARFRHYPAQLSGGEQQRVALARAFANRPKMLFADEPTGNLDLENAHRVRELMFELNRSQGTTILLVTHDMEFARCAARIISLRGGRIQSDSQANATEGP